MPCVRIIGVAHDATLTFFFSAGKKMSWSVSIHAESNGVTGAFELRPVQTDQEICKVPVRKSLEAGPKTHCEV